VVRTLFIWLGSFIFTYYTRRLMKVERKDNKLLIEIDIQDPITPSGSGKMLTVASSRGNKATDISIDGKTLIVGVNAYIPK